MNQYLDTLNIKGIIQAGANSGQEIGIFRNYTDNIILFEPIPYLAQSLKHSNPDLDIFCCGLGSIDCIKTLYVSSNNGESSSILKPINHTVYYPNINFDNHIEIEIKTIKSLVDISKIDIEKFNVLVSDTQGYDLEVIKGFGSYIQKIDLIIAEYINSNLYEHDASLDDMIEYLIPLGFKLITTFDENLGAGNAVFKKETI